MAAGALALLGVLGFAGSAHACSCAEIATRDALRQADGAVVAELLEVVPRSNGVADYRYEVARAYKAVRRVGSVISVRSAMQGAACGLPKDLGRRYGLFLSWGGGRWRGGLCGVVAPRRLRAVAKRMPSKAGGSSGGPSSCNS